MTDQEPAAADAPSTGVPADAAALDRRAELSEFLRTRRARIKPSDVGLPDYGNRRRVPGLRREELSQLAGVSVAYYTRLEQGNGANVSTEILEAISRALRLTDAEHAHLLHLTKPKQHKKKRRGGARQQVRPALQQLLDAMEGVPAYIVGRRTDILAWNRAAAALFGDIASWKPEDRNWSRMIFLNPQVKALFVNPEQKASDVVSYLRMDAGCHPDDPELSALVGQLSVKSEEFRRLWAAHDVKEKGHGTKVLRHPLVGELTLSYETLQLADDGEQCLSTYHAEPGTPSAEALRLLVSWGADATAERTSHANDQS
ncbi:helix-turn-helix transcriptional regulator [Streptomyces sp. N35]|uniref:helix-turn-helix transcriptional regulator n=1 Tax=Streptomyces sp. N35 TaxID=2795730 RepID=UPI0018F57F9D|nr:helix-turn-helix transcriptional regulator [Streptomyces sp. N35]